jgi:gamma-glutamyl hydrolase
MKPLSIVLLCIILGAAMSQSRNIRDMSGTILNTNPAQRRMMSPFIRMRLQPELVSDNFGEDQEVNLRPMVGILTQPFNDTHDYIMAAYVKFVEQAGARVVPINWRHSDEETLELVEKLNGVVYPGGGTELVHEDGSLTEYSQKGKVILDKIKQINDQGVYYPVWAVCLGMQEVSVIEAPYEGVLDVNGYDGMNQAANMTFVSDLSNSRMFRNMPQHLVNALQKENITFYWHHDGLLPSTFEKYQSLKEYTVLAVSYDKVGKLFAASFEHKSYPIYGHQFHPEKNAFIWVDSLEVPHTNNAIELEQYFAKFFVGETKKNFNHFETVQEELNHMIENDQYFLDKEGMHQDIYLFPL